GESFDHTQDVVVDQEVLPERVLRGDAFRAHRRPKAALAFRSICRSRSGASSRRAAASAARVCTTFAGSLGRPRRGWGDRSGLSGSTRRRSAGTRAAAARSSVAFGYVTLPANDT